MVKMLSARFGIVLVLALSAVLAAGCSSGKTPESSSRKSAKAAAEWEVLGPGGGGAQFLSTINPLDPNHVFVRCDMTGAYVTHDGGKHWRMFNLRTVVRDYEFDPVNPNTAYASNSGVYRTDDRGDSWRLVYPRPEDIDEELMQGDHADHSFRTRDGEIIRSVTQVMVDPAAPENVYIGDVRPEGKVRLMHSGDKGMSWDELAVVDGRGALAIYPGSWYGKNGEIMLFTPNTAWKIDCATGSATLIGLPGENIVFAEAGASDGKAVLYVLTAFEETGGKLEGGMYRSDDLGASWTAVNNGLASDWKSGMRLPSYRTFGVCEGTPDIVYISAYNYPYTREDGTPGRKFGILKSENGGQSWRWVYEAVSDSLLSNNLKGAWMLKNYGPEWGEFPLSLGVCPTNPDICWSNDLGCTYRTLDGGQTWEQMYSNEKPDGSWSSRGLDVTTNYGVHFDPFDPQHVFISYTDIGAFHSFNGGKSWVQAITGTPRRWINTCYWMVFDPEVKGRAWGVWGSGHDLPRPKMFRGGNFDRYVGGVTVSDDAARTWKQSNDGMQPNTVCTHILLDPDSPAESRTLFVSAFGKGVFRSTDGGAHWELKNDGIGHNLNAWRITRTPDGKLYLLVSRGLENRQVVDGAMYTSTDGGESWQGLTMPAGTNAPNDLVYDPEKPERMYLACWPDDEGKGGGLWRTEDGGGSWMLVFEEDAHVYGVALDPQNPGTVIINTFDSAAFRSDNRGQNWRRLEGYTFKWGHRPVFDIHNPGMIYLTTFGGSVFHGPAEGVPGAFEGILDPTWEKWYGKY